jgi:hypothetical protein
MFSVVPSASGQAMVVRPASAERMVNSSGQPVTDSDIHMSLGDLRKCIHSVLGGGGK